MRKYAFPEDGDIAEDLKVSFGYIRDLVDIYTGIKGALVHKWHHYLPLYDRYFSPWRGKPVRFLEIGVSKGGSLSMWRKWFGPDAVIYGVDINPRCDRFDGIDGEVRIGSQADPKFLKHVDMHSWYHEQPMRNKGRGRWMTGFHVHDPVVVIDMAPVRRPTASKVGK